ncbi:hypothetical protein LGQ02_05960 [Bacillus shivajii]|uniref:hypothetical protein n=1 Tax=Bacillus shivajii TaxID=1983719 RepID=UPI001CFB0517|nr:hypothetical protein [Bacillus shivajii]UCZ54306.1 hypothetical protein LGQ02_05960 [Bacillus shivajii]
MKKQVIIYTILSIIGIFILNLMVNMQGNTRDITETNVLLSVLCVMFGILIEWRKILTIFKSGVNVNWLIVPSVILLMIAILPYGFSIVVIVIHNIFGTSLNPPIVTPLLTESVRNITFVFAGIILVRSLTKEKHA